MVNKTIKAVVAALAILAGGSVRANAQASEGGVAQTQPITQHNCNSGGMTATTSGQCTSNMTINQTIAPAGRARGDVLRLSGRSKGTLSTSKAGVIEVPQVGQVYEYQYGKNITLVIGSFNLRGKNANVKGQLAAVINKAKNDPNYIANNTIIIYGRRLAKSSEVVEIGETLTSAKDLSNTVVKYQPMGADSFSFTTPKNAGAEEFIVDLNAILK